MDTNQLAQMLMEIQCATPISYTSITEADVYVRNNPFNLPIWKTNKVNGIVCFWYDQAVLRRLAKEGKSPEVFRQGTSWHMPVFMNNRLTALCQSKNPDNHKLYLRLMYIQTCGEPSYHNENGIVTKEELYPFLKKKNNYENQGADKPVVIITPSLDSIQNITLNGQTYAIQKFMRAA